jgi:membrane protease YdiL (CAAX protease family)
MTPRSANCTGVSPDVARAVAFPVALLVLGALVRETRPLTLAVLLAGFLIALRANSSVRWALAAALPIAVALCWGLLPTPLADVGGADCANPLSPPAAWRMGEAAVVLGSIAILAWWLRVSPETLLLRRPSRPVIGLSLVGFVVFGPLALLLGAVLARPFFGTFSLDLGQPGAVVPALLFAVANGVMEEIAYRGVFVAWMGRLTGVWPAVVLQALLFGLAHGGPDFVSSPLPVMAAMTAGALIAAVIAIRTRSLLLPIAIHVALDLPIYYYFACRAA